MLHAQAEVQKENSKYRVVKARIEENSKCDKPPDVSRKLVHVERSIRGLILSETGLDRIRWRMATAERDYCRSASAVVQRRNMRWRRYPGGRVNGMGVRFYLELEGITIIAWNFSP